jgi:hypothetical protein
MHLEDWGIVQFVVRTSASLDVDETSLPADVHENYRVTVFSYKVQGQQMAFLASFCAETFRCKSGL